MMMISAVRASFGYPPDPEDVLPPSASAPEPRRSKRVLSLAGYYAALAGMSPGRLVSR